MRIRLEGKQLHNALHLRTKCCTVGQHFENVGLSTSRFAENSVFGANNLKKHTYKPSGDIFVFRHAFLRGESMVY